MLNTLQSLFGCCNVAGIKQKEKGDNRAKSCNKHREHNLGKGPFTGTLRLGR